MEFHPRLEEIQVARNDKGEHMGWIGKMGDGYTWVVPNTDTSPYGLMSIDQYANGNFETREAAMRMLTGMYARPEVYGFKREDWAEVWH